MKINDRKLHDVQFSYEELKAFEKVALAPKESKKITFTLGFDELREWAISRKYEVNPHRLTIMLGDGSDRIVWEEKFEVR